MTTDPTNVTRRKHKLELHNRRIQWDTPIAKWAGEANDWIQVVTRGPLRKEDVTVRLHATMRHVAGHRKDKKSGLPTKKPRDPDPLILEEPAENKKIILEMRGDSKTIVDWVFGPKLPACVFSGTVVAKTARADRSRSFGFGTAWTSFLPLWLPPGFVATLEVCTPRTKPRFWQLVHHYSLQSTFFCVQLGGTRCVSLEVSLHEVLFLSWSEPCAFSLSPCSF